MGVTENKLFIHYLITLYQTQEVTNAVRYEGTVTRVEWRKWKWSWYI